MFAHKAYYQMSLNYHPFFFLLMALVAMTELGLTAFLINSGNDFDTWPSPRYHKLYVFVSRLIPSCAPQ